MVDYKNQGMGAYMVSFASVHLSLFVWLYGAHKHILSSMVKRVSVKIYNLFSRYLGQLKLGIRIKDESCLKGV